MKNSRYDIQFKIDSVKDFLRRKSDNPNFGYGRYSEMIHVKRTTFIAWVEKYKSSELNYNEPKVSPSSLIMNVNDDNNDDFINLSEDTYEVVNVNERINSNADTTFSNISNNPNKNMSLKINGASIEFDPSYLKKVIEVLKTC